MNQQQKNRAAIKRVAVIAIFSALAIVLGLWEIPWPGSIIGLRLDFSDVITVISIGIIGFKGTSIMLFIKALLRFLIIRLGAQLGPWAGMFEEFMALFASFMYVFSFMILKKVNKAKNIFIKIGIDVAFTSVFLAVTMLFFNFLFSTPMYLYFLIGADNFHVTVFSMIGDPQYRGALAGINVKDISVFGFFIFCIVTYVPFNFVKGISSALVGTITAARLMTINYVKDIWPNKKLEKENVNDTNIE
ncbi:hypothetical protein LJC17_03835 [Acholeplasma sp. OttesenSCG-928-E16]|nr:hypothetical protein [Acholeplasma sp. OttesenSCG-928-E16]